MVATMPIVPNRKEFTVMRAAELIGCSAATIYRWADEGFLQVVRRPKNRILVPREAIIRALTQGQ